MNIDEFIKIISNNIDKININAEDVEESLLNNEQ